MIKFYDITSTALASKPFEEQAIYACTDNGTFWIDSIAEQERIQIGLDIAIVATESARANILAPIPNKIYCVVATGSMYIYHNGAWHRLGTSQLSIFDVAVVNGSATVSDSRIISSDIAKFIPYGDYTDLISNISCTCKDGSVVISATSNYEVFGVLQIG